MTFYCKGVCEKYKAGKPKSGKRYESGQSRCQTCDIYIEWDGLRCPCCNGKLRKNAHNSKFKFQKYESLNNRIDTIV